MLTCGMFLFGFFLLIEYIEAEHPMVLEGDFPFLNMAFYRNINDQNLYTFSPMKETKMQN